MADLPDIPDQAIQAAHTAMMWRSVNTPDEARATLAGGLEAAWPHLYAAALPHDQDIDLARSILPWATRVAPHYGRWVDFRADVSRETPAQP